MWRSTLIKCGKTVTYFKTIKHWKNGLNTKNHLNILDTSTKWWFTEIYTYLYYTIKRESLKVLVGRLAFGTNLRAHLNYNMFRWVFLIITNTHLNILIKTYLSGLFIYKVLDELIVEWVSTQVPHRKIKKICLEYKQPNNSISMRPFGRCPKPKPCGLSPKRTISYYAELTSLARPNT